MKKCWANQLGNCSDKISREHIVSRGIIACNKDMKIPIRGLSWCKNESKVVGINALVKKCLCTTHNNMLSEIDKEGIRFWNILNYIYEQYFWEGIDRQSINTCSQKTELTTQTFSGNLLERWFLKTLINFYCDSEQQVGWNNAARGRPDIYLIHAVFGKALLINGMGIYSIACNDSEIDSRGEISIMPIILDGRIIIGAVFSFRGIDFFLSLTPHAPPPLELIARLDRFIAYSSRLVLTYRSPSMQWDINGDPFYKINIEW